MKSNMKVKGQCKKKFYRLIKVCLVVFFLIFVLINCFFDSKQSIAFLVYRPMIVATGSMEPEYQTNSLVVIKKAKFENLQVGDVVAYKSMDLSQDIIFHRVIMITEDGFYTKGDNNKHQDNQLVTTEQLVGKCIYNTNVTSQYINKLKDVKGMIVFLVIPIGAIVIIIYTSKKLLLKNKKNSEEII